MRYRFNEARLYIENSSNYYSLLIRKVIEELNLKKKANHDTTSKQPQTDDIMSGI